jgi:hypothetical protein
LHFFLGDVAVASAGPKQDSGEGLLFSEFLAAAAFLTENIVE